ncbi:Uncharacterized protein dnm_077910 [Desulfonema magnum]|uniref:Uncharacterized protein n=1 Tax=Desulfonema magnum TaxID=45655 RepID=A0A975BUS5_9BACT|nr:Uncharacterized protein dnm_077910 [Desulfonema magnum]
MLQKNLFKIVVTGQIEFLICDLIFIIRHLINGKNPSERF